MTNKVIPGLGENALDGLPDQKDVDRILKSKERQAERKKKRAENDAKATANSKWESRKSDPVQESVHPALR